MGHPTAAMGAVKNIALVAHDNKKDDLVNWAQYNKELLSRHNLFATGTTGKIVSDLLGLSIIRLQSGPLGGDQQVGSKIADGEIDFLIFFWDPLAAQPHDPDVRALLRLAVVWNIPVAMNRATADFLVSSALIDAPYQRQLTDYEDYKSRYEKRTRDVG